VIFDNHGRAVLKRDFLIQVFGTQGPGLRTHARSGILISAGCASQKGTGVPGTCVTSLEPLSKALREVLRVRARP
jgi:hypothetical protein